MPLGGNRFGLLRQMFSLFITMLIGGLWHGAGWIFIVWGGLHGIYLIINHGWHIIRRALGHDLEKSSWWGRGLSHIITFLAVVVSWVFFRAESFAGAKSILWSMAGMNGISLPTFLAGRFHLIQGRKLSSAWGQAK